MYTIFVSDKGKQVERLGRKTIGPHSKQSWQPVTEEKI